MSIKTSTENFFKDFKAFAMKGNVVDLAVAVVIGGAFGKIVTSFVENIITPFISLMTSGVDLSQAHWVLRDAIEADPAQGIQAQPALMLEYGKFGQSIMDFLIIAFCIFLAIKAMSSLKNKEEASETPKKEPQVELLEEIRDLLKKDSANTPS